MARAVKTRSRYTHTRLSKLQGYERYFGAATYDPLFFFLV